MFRRGGAAIVLKRPGRKGGRSWQDTLRWRESATGIVLGREWGVVGSERLRRRARAYPTREACQVAIDRTVIRLQRLGYRVR